MQICGIFEGFLLNQCIVWVGVIFHDPCLWCHFGSKSASFCCGKFDMDTKSSQVARAIKRPPWENSV